MSSTVSLLKDFTQGLLELVGIRLSLVEVLGLLNHLLHTFKLLDELAIDVRTSFFVAGKTSGGVP